MTGPIEDRAPLRERVNSWVQIAAIVLAGLWGIYTFIYKEYLVPRSSPAFISVDVEMDRVGSNDSLEAMQLRLKVTNQGERTIFTLPSVATVWGSQLQDTPEINDSTFLSSIELTLNADTFSDRHLNRHVGTSKRELVGFFRLFSGYEFLPKSTAAYELLVYVPRGKYDQLDADVAFPVVSDTTDITAQWVMRPDSAFIELFRIQGRKLQALSPSEGRDRRFVYKKDYALIDSYTEFSLWPRAIGENLLQEPVRKLDETP
jgi:hypothetical protein